MWFYKVKKITKAQEMEREAGFDYSVLMKCAQIREGFLAPRWKEDNAANLKR